MERKEIDLRLDPEHELPVYLQIRDQLRERILAGDLPAGTRLPPQRELARSLGLSRTTVVNAYEELASEGLVEAHVGRGTLVTAPPLPADPHPIAWHAHFSNLGRRITQHPSTSSPLVHRSQECISLAFGLPDPSLLDPARLQKAWEAIVKRLGAGAVGLCPAQGTHEVRTAIAGRMQARRAAVRPEDVVVVNGSQHGLDLILRLLVEPGDAVLVETPTYFGALQSFNAWGVRAIGVPMDEAGMDVERVKFLLARYHPRLIYTVPTYQNPTGITMSLERREQLVALAQQYQVPIVEDDPFGDLYFDTPPPPPLRALDHHGHVLYLGTFSKILAPGLRVGWIAGPGPLLERAALLNQVTELQPNSVGQHLVAEFARQGWLEALIERARHTYYARCRTMDQALRRHRLPDTHWSLPQGGMFLWLHLPQQVDGEELLEETGRQGVIFLPGGLMYPSGSPRSECRLNFSVPTEREIKQGIATLAATLKDVLRRPAGTSGRSMPPDPIV
jgi:DNA-binding transcriptional MocR family regulator